MVDARSSQLLKSIQHQVACVGSPLTDDPQTQGTCLATEIHQIAVDAPHFKNQCANPLGPYWRLYACKLLDRCCVAVFIEIRLGYADAAHDRKALDESAALHQLLEATVQVADVGFPFHHLVTADSEFDRHVASDTRMVRALPKFQVFA